jgi:hypothetical protein
VISAVVSVAGRWHVAGASVSLAAAAVGPTAAWPRREKAWDEQTVVPGRKRVLLLRIGHWHK